MFVGGLNWETTEGYYYTSITYILKLVSSTDLVFIM